MLSLACLKSPTSPISFLKQLTSFRGQGFDKGFDKMVLRNTKFMDNQAVFMEILTCKSR